VFREKHASVEHSRYYHKRSSAHDIHQCPS